MASTTTGGYVMARDSLLINMASPRILPKASCILVSFEIESIA